MSNWLFGLDSFLFSYLKWFSRLLDSKSIILHACVMMGDRLQGRHEKNKMGEKGTFDRKHRKK